MISEKTVEKYKKTKQKQQAAETAPAPSDRNSPGQLGDIEVTRGKNPWIVIEPPEPGTPGSVGSQNGKNPVVDRKGKGFISGAGMTTESTSTVIKRIARSRNGR